MIKNDKRLDKRVGKPNKRNNRRFVRILAFLGVFAVCFTFLLPTLNFNNVSAKSTTFIQQNDYTIGICGFNGIAIDYTDDETYCTLASMPFLSFDGGDSEFVKISFNEFNGDWPIYKTYNLSKVSATKYQLIGSIPVAFYSKNEYDNTLNPYSEQGLINLNCNQIDFYVKTPNASLEDFYARVTTIFGYNYGTYPNIKKLYNFEDVNGETVGQLYLTFPSFVRTSGDNDYIYSDEVIKIDRSEYIRTEIVRDEVIIDEVNDYKSFFTVIKNGMMSFFGITIFGDFTVGHFVAIALSFVAFKFLLHIIAK